MESIALMDQQQLAPLCLPPPPTATAWQGVTTQSPHHEIVRRDGGTVTIPLPLFWYAPDWYQVEVDLADLLAAAISERGILVAALRSELGPPDQQPLLYGAAPSDQPGGSANETLTAAGSNQSAPVSTPPRIVPYRPERYGLAGQDFDGAAIIDVRLTLTRDPSGRFAFPPAQLERWESTPADEPVGGGAWVPAASFPPDVVSIDHLASKLMQLRALSPSAAVFVSLWPYRLTEELPQLVGAGPDGIILRLDRLSLDGLQLARLVRTARSLLDQTGAKAMPLWIATAGEIVPEDAVKLIALGASAVGIDGWCRQVRDHAVHSRTSSTAARLGYAAAESDSVEALLTMIDNQMGERLERFLGHYLTLSQVDVAQQLGSFDPHWAEALGVSQLG